MFVFVEEFVIFLFYFLQVYFVCGKMNVLKSVKEPKQCFYEAKFETPLVCGSNSMVVYPRLPIHLQDKWDKVYTDYKAGIFTEKVSHYFYFHLFSSHLLILNDKSFFLIKTSLSILDFLHFF